MIHWPIIRTLFLASTVSLLLGCKKDEPVVPQDMGTGYFPLKVGSWVEYQVDSMWRDDLLNIHDSVSYRLLERVEEVYTDGAGRQAFRILRFVRDEANAWRVRDVWTAIRDERFAETTEENMRRLKLAFPVREARTWDINVFNTERTLEVAFRDVDSPWSGGGLSFDRTVLVRNILGPNAVEKRNFEERYAHDVGLVQKYWEETNTQFNSSSQQFVVRGFRLNMVAIEHDVQ